MYIHASLAVMAESLSFLQAGSSKVCAFLGGWLATNAHLISHPHLPCIFPSSPPWQALGNTIKKVDGSIEELDEIAAELTMKTVPGGNAAAVDASASVSVSCSDETTASTAALSSSVASSSAASSSASASGTFSYYSS